MKILSGKRVAEQINATTSEIIQKNKLKPHLSILTIDDNWENKIYLEQKIKKGKELGTEVSIYKFNSNDSSDEIVKTIDFLNQDDDVSAIIIQLPLPDIFSEETAKFLNQILPDKDVDVLADQTIGNYPNRIFSNFFELKENFQKNKIFLPPTASAIIEIFNFYHILIENPTIIGNGRLVGAPLSKVFNLLNIQYDQIKDEAELEISCEKIKKAKIIISGTSTKNYILNSSDVNDKAIIIDCASDFNHNSIDDNFKGQITPNIGGIGPITIACLMRNTALASLWHK